MVRLVLFDIDGTLISTDRAGVTAFARAFASAFDLHHGAERMRFAGRTDHSLIREFLAGHNIAATPEHFQRFAESYVFWLDHLLPQRQGRVLPGVNEWLRGLARARPRPVIGLLTGNTRLGAEIKLRHFGLWEYFETGAFGDDHEDRNQLAVIAHRRGGRLIGCELKGHEILVVGDTPHDIACGRAIGAKVLAVATGGATLDELKSHTPDWAVPSLGNLKLSTCF